MPNIAPLYIFDLGHGVKIIAHSTNEAYAAVAKSADDAQRLLRNWVGESRVAPGHFPILAELTKSCG